MTNPGSTNQPPTNIPAGWYPDPAGNARSRWWDGTQWTEHFHDPAAQPAQVSQAAPYGTPAADLKAPEGTATNTVWIWLIIFLPLVPLLPLLFIDWTALFHFDPDDPASVIASQLALYTAPAYLIAMFGGWLVYGLSVWFAYLDSKQLKTAGVPKPFHWAFAFLGSVVYAIGRSVVVKRRTGSGSAPMWAAIGTIVLMFVFVIYLTVSIISSALHMM